MKTFEPQEKVLITGVTGCLGRHLERFLTQRNVKVVGLTRSAPTSPTHIQTDYNAASLKALFDTHTFSAVFHLASPTNRSRALSLVDSHINEQVILTERLLECCPPATRFMFASTCEVYGNSAGAAKEEQAPAPVSPYSFGKACTELLIQLNRTLRGGSFTIFRIYNLFGDGLDKSHFLAQLLEALEKREQFPMTSGAQRRDFISVAFVVETLYAALQSSAVENQIVNVSRGSSISIKELALHIARHFNAEGLLQIGALPYRENEIWDAYGDTHKLHNLLGKRATTHWEEEISQWLALRGG